MQRFHAQVGKPRVERRRLRAHVAHELHARLGNIRRAPEIARVRHAVIAGVGLGEILELAVRKIEFSAVDYKPADRRVVSVEVFCGAVNNHVRAELERSAQHGRGERGIHD